MQTNNKVFFSNPRFQSYEQLNKMTLAYKIQLRIGIEEQVKRAYRTID